MVWAEFGKPNQRERLPSQADQEEYPANDGLYTSGYRLISTQPSRRCYGRSVRTDVDRGSSATELYRPPVEWLGAARLRCRHLVYLRLGGLLMTIWIRKIFANAMAAHWAEYRALSVVADPTPKQRFELETQKGALFLDQLRRNMGDDRFFKLMADFFAAHKTQAVTAQSFSGCRGRELRFASRQRRADVSGVRHPRAPQHRDSGVWHHDRRRRESLCR